MSARAELAAIIAGVTDLWDEPLDEVHDIPQIANAIITAGWSQPKGKPAPKPGDSFRIFCTHADGHDASADVTAQRVTPLNGDRYRITAARPGSQVLEFMVDRNGKEVQP